MKSLVPGLDGILRRIEAMGLSAAEHHWALIPPELAKGSHPQVARVGDGLLTLMRKSDSLRTNRVIALGHRGAARESMIDAIIERYREAQLKRFSLVLGPGPQAEEIQGWLSKRGFVPHGGYALLLRDCRVPVPRLPAELRVARALREQRGLVVRILGETFGIPESRRAWSMAAAASRDYEHFIAFIGTAAAGVGALRKKGDLGWLGGGATRTRWRRHGVHASLIAARLRRAARLGCRWAWSETMEQRPGRPNGSRRNLMRLGFEQVRVKPIFLWEER